MKSRIAKSFSMEDTREFVRIMIKSNNSQELQQGLKDSFTKFQFLEEKAKDAPKDSLLTISTASYDGEARNVAYHYAPEEKELDNNTCYNIGSLSKVFMLAITLRLAHQNKFSLDTKLTDIITQNFNAAHPALIKIFNRLNEITVKHLLSHRSGLKDREYLIYNKGYPLNTFILNGTFNELYYANVNYIILAYILEAVTGKTVASLYEELIKKPLNLTNTHFINNNSLKNTKIASGYNVKSKKTEADCMYMFGAICFLSTPSDCSKFLWHFFKDPNFISLSLLNEVKDSVTFNNYEVKRRGGVFFTWQAYGGIGIEKFIYKNGSFDPSLPENGADTHILFGHGGWTNGSSSFAVFDSTTQTAYCVMVTKRHQPEVKPAQNRLFFPWSINTASHGEVRKESASIPKVCSLIKNTSEKDPALAFSMGEQFLFWKTYHHSKKTLTPIKQAIESVRRQMIMDVYN